MIRISLIARPCECVWCRELAAKQRERAKLENSVQQQAAKQAQMELDALEAAARRGECSELQQAELQRKRCTLLCDFDCMSLIVSLIAYDCVSLIERL